MPFADWVPHLATDLEIAAKHIDEGDDAATIAGRENFPLETVSEIISAVNRNEYKRRQAPPGLKVTSKAFGSGRRMPIAAKF